MGANEEIQKIMTPQEKAKYFIDQLGIEGAKRQAMDEICNADTNEERDYFYQIIDIINKLNL